MAAPSGTGAADAPAPRRFSCSSRASRPRRSSLPEDRAPSSWNSLRSRRSMSDTITVAPALEETGLLLGSRHCRPLIMEDLAVMQMDGLVSSFSGSSFSRTPGDKSFRAQYSEPFPRLLDRKATFHQSYGHFQLRTVSDSGQTRSLILGDLFHNMVSMSLPRLVASCVVMVASSWLIFAGLFRWVSKDCGLEANTFVRALYLAVETVETIGYGIPDPEMNGCYRGVFIMGLAALWGSMMDALLVGLVLSRMKRAQERASSVCFTKKGIVCQVEGQNYFMFQIFDFRKDHICEAHVRLYCVQHTATEDGVTHQTRAMRLQHPDDELGSMLFMGLPAIVVHRIDAWSPLCPPSHRHIPGGNKATCFDSFPDVVQRGCDAESGQRDGGGCQRLPVPSRQDIARHVAEAQMEVLCLVEGVEPAASGTLQARCSYTTDDIIYNASFQRCVSRGSDGNCEVNLDAFHELVPGNKLLVQSIP